MRGSDYFNILFIMLYILAPFGAIFIIDFKYKSSCNNMYNVLTLFSAFTILPSMLKGISSMFNKLDYYSLKDNQYICNKCHHQLTANFENHALSCDGTGPKRKTYFNPTEELKEQYLIENNKWICKKCDLEISSRRDEHANACDGTGKWGSFDLDKINNQIKEGQLCSFGCGKPAIKFFKFTKNFCCSNNANSCEANRKKNSQAKKGINPWEGKVHPRPALGKSSHNKGKKLEQLYSPEKIFKIKEAQIEAGKNKTPLTPQQEQQRREKLRQHALNNNYGGYQKGSGRGKSGWYQGYWCDSSYELAFVIYHLEHNIEFKRNTQSYEYIYQGKTHQYYPDFLVADKLIEIKGYIDEQVQEKLKQCPVTIEVWMKEDMKHIFDYVHTKYGKKFISLYEKT